MLKLEDKKVIVDEVSKVASNAISAGVADYRGLTVAEMTELRAKARESGVYLRVVRNTLAKRAVENTEFACMADVFTGPVFLAFSEGDPGVVARLLKEAMKNYTKLSVCALVLGGKMFGSEDIEAISKLPTRDQAIAIFMSTAKAPVDKLAKTLSETYAMLVRTVAAVGEKKTA